MTKGNVIDFVSYRNRRNDNKTELDTVTNDELKTAIQDLILRLRELGPIQTA